MPIIQISSTSEFNKIISSTPFVVANFFAEWCGPCRALSPEITRLGTVYPNATILRLNADNFHDLSAKYSVSSLPTVLLLNKGKIIDSVIGADVRKITSLIEMSHNNAAPKKCIGDVCLHIYDLSNGMAASMSQALTGQFFEAVYHTGVVVDGKEYFFGGDGISVGYPAQTPFGTPIRKEVLGYSELDVSELNKVISDLSSSFSGDKYNFLQHNCNTFSNTFSGRLLNRSNPVPREIIDQPKKFLSTSFGAQIEPLINNYFNNSRGYAVDNQQSVVTTATAEPIFFKKLSVDNILQKIITSGSCRASLNDLEISQISSLIQKLPQYIEDDQITVEEVTTFVTLLDKIAQKMNTNDTFVIVDLLRGLILTTAASSVDFPEFISLGKIVSNSLQSGASDAYKTMALRLISNSFYRETGRRFLENQAVIAMVLNCVEYLGTESSHKNVRVAAATLAMNTLILAPNSVLSQNKNKDRFIEVLKKNIEFRPEASIFTTNL